MTLQVPTTAATAATARTTPAGATLDALTPEGRDALLDLAWAAWYSSRPEAAKVLLAGAETGDPLDVARAAGVTAEANLKLMRLRRVAAGDRETIALVDGLREGDPLLHVPVRLRRVMAATDDDRRRMLVRARADVALLPQQASETVAAVLGYLVGTEVDYAGARVVEVPLARGYCRAVMHTLGLPFDGYMARMRAWL